MTLRLIFSFLVGLSFYGVSASFFSWAGVGGAIILSCLLIPALALAVLTLQRVQLADEIRLDSSPERFGFTALAVTSSLSFGFLFYQARGFWWTRNPNNLGDLPMHIHFIRYFERGGTLADSHPLLFGAPFKYPSAMNLFSASMESIGVNTSFHLAVVGIVMTLALLWLLFLWSRWFGVLTFLWSGGWSVSGLSMGWQPGGDLAWKNLFLSVWVTQRGFLFALPAGLLLLLVQRRLAKKRESVNRIVLLGGGLLWLALAYFHLHSFVMVSFLLLLQAIELRDRSFPIVLAWGLPIALLPIFRSLGEAQGSLHWDLNWLAPEDDPLFFWFRNFGFWLIIPILVLWHGRARWIENMLLGLSTLLLVNLMLAPWAWDQVKVLIWLFLFWNLRAYNEFIKEWIWWKQAVLVAAICFPGFHQWLSGLPIHQTPVKLFSIPEVQEMQRLTRTLPVADSVLTATSYSHPILATGQQMWMGYEGHLWSHQLSYQGNKQLLDEVRGKKYSSAAKTPRWILFSPYEKDILGPESQGGGDQWTLRSFSEWASSSSPPSSSAE